ncbi:haloacid dehalogenase type II [Phycicoccus sp. BSK3Z-2]|uniref:Haloacid dehalogenase type II n=1 Tax=Phycicoccus avicenniae TaxID=2828860 RepID=A0A941D4X5_9MICO|nr:haloacid dehalogenase type II [Phycicoccus avicenniae]MBR7741766.1 haloacid dehalogenase type II [Phycicoccus avicenniae]
MSHAPLPALIVLDVNETLSDLSPVATAFTDLGLPDHLAATWFAGTLRDGMALTVVGENPVFADLARASFHSLVGGRADAPDDLDAAADQVLEAFTTLPLHPDVEPGLRALDDLGIRLVTLSNGSVEVAQGLVERNDLGGVLDELLSVTDAPLWKPDPLAYKYALSTCEVEPEDAMLVAVHPWDVHGAATAGMRTAYVARSGAPYPHDTMRSPELTVSSLTDLADRFAD